MAQGHTADRSPSQDENQTPQHLALCCCSLPSPLGAPLLGLFRGPWGLKNSRWKDSGHWESHQVHAGCGLCVALPPAAFPGHTARAAEGMSRWEPPPTLRALLPPGKELSQQHWSGTQLAVSGSGLESLASEERGKGRKSGWGMVRSRLGTQVVLSGPFM